jgi:hypothetical protein
MTCAPSQHQRSLIAVAASLAMAITNALTASGAYGQLALNAGTWGIHGHVVVETIPSPGVAVPPELQRIELPNAQVRAREIATGVTSSPVTTNAHGYYQLSHLPAGTYQVCAAAPGLPRECLPNNVTLTNFTVFVPDDIRLQPKEPVIVGRVRLADPAHTPCFTDRPAFHTFISAEVTLDDASGNRVAGPARGNGIGEYVLPVGQLAAGQYELVASCQDGKGQASVTPGPAVIFRDIVIPNSPPRIRRIETMLNNKPVRDGAPGATITLDAVADDPDGNLLEFKRVASDGTVLGGPGPTIQMVLPNTPSSTTVFVEANDARGGFAYRLVPVTGAQPEAALFTGMVINARTKVPVANSDVTVNGKHVLTDGNGLFTVRVPIGVRYTISVRKLGFALLSKVTYSPAAELRLPIEPVVGQPFDLRRGGTISTTETDRGSLSVTLNYLPTA